MSFYKSIVLLFICLLFIGLETVDSVAAEADAADSSHDVCQTDCQFYYVNNHSTTLVNGKNNSRFAPITSLVAQKAGGTIYNYYSLSKPASNATESQLVPIDPLVEAESLITVQGEEGSEAVTSIGGGNLKLKQLMKKHLRLNGFTVKENYQAQATDKKEVSLIFTEAQGEAFLTGGEGNLSSAAPSNGTDKLNQYTQAIQDALNEYHTEKNVWIWDSPSVTKNLEEAMQFLTDQQVTNIYLHFDTRIPDPVYRSFIQKASNQGITVHALMGQPKWGLKAYTSEALHRIDLVAKYNHNASPREQFAGIHFDIEPYVMDVWDHERTTVLKEWSASAKQYISYAKSKGFIVGSSLPFWTDQSAVEVHYPDFYKEMIDRQDYVTLMAYRNKALGSNSITKLTAGEMKYATSPKVEIGVELLPNSVDYLSFHNRSTVDMEKELAHVRNYYTQLKSKGFKGITIHDYEEWKAKPALPFENSEPKSFSRISGHTRYETSEAFTNKIPDHSLDTVILTDGTNYPDALAGGVLNKSLNGVIMLVNDRQNVLQPKLKEAQRLLKDNGRITVLGGTGAVSSAVSQQFHDLGYPVIRIAGTNRVETAIQIAQHVKDKPAQLFIADGNNFADALSIVPYATKSQAPILLNTANAGLNQEIISYIQTHPSVTSATIIGGPNAVPPQAETMLKQLGIPKIRRIAGTERSLTALKIATTYYPRATQAGISNGHRFPDALSGSRYAYSHDMPILLTDSDHVNRDVANFSKQLHNFVFFGGEGVLSPALKSTFK
ncbi:cell wall-binding repeat-containing protein [Halobacillus rhizosphaerae]|uniref:cell wall-binding repeat-containing protein n=1 Tax=Halobacillus rhizosphaerae TaxID=3064889 RepID=UPI00398B7BAE